MSSQPWSDSQVQGFFHLLFSREMFPSHKEKRLPRPAHRPCTPSASPALALGRGPFARACVTGKPGSAASLGLQSQHSPRQRCLSQPGSASEQGLLEDLQDLEGGFATVIFMVVDTHAPRVPVDRTRAEASKPIHHLSGRSPAPPGGPAPPPALS